MELFQCLLGEILGGVPERPLVPHQTEEPRQQVLVAAIGRLQVETLQQIVDNDIVLLVQLVPEDVSLEYRDTLPVGAGLTPSQPVFLVCLAASSQLVSIQVPENRDAVQGQIELSPTLFPHRSGLCRHRIGI